MKKKVVTVKELLGWFEGYIAKDANGSIYLYQSKPEIDFKNKKWNPKQIDANFEKLYELFEIPELDDVDWKDSLRCPKIRREIPTERTLVGTKVWVSHNKSEWLKGIFLRKNSDVDFTVFGLNWNIKHYRFCEIATREDKVNDFRED